MSFTLRIYESEYKEIESLVLKYPNIETGGDLFGLWTSGADPVVQLIIGPGEKCRRTSVSFHQDTDYLHNIGTYVNTTFMLCHIGSWHSHHQLSLKQPSAGDRSTVCNNFPRGLQRYIMIIVNIESPTRNRAKTSVVIHPYMFTNEGHVCKRGTVQTISSPSPFREDGYLLEKLNTGAEHSRASTDRDVYTRVTSSRRDRSPTRIDQTSFNKSRPQSTVKAREQNGYRSDKNQWYTSDKGKVKLIQIQQEILEKLKPSSEIQFQRNSVSLDLTLEFSHNDRIWVVTFPSSFDKESATITSKSTEPMSSKNIVEDVQRACTCTRCRETHIETRDLAASRGDRDVNARKGGNLGNRKVSPRRERSRADEVPRRNAPSPFNYSCNFAAEPRRPSVRKNTGQTDEKYRVRTARDRQQWYQSDDGEKMLRRICTKISTLLLQGKSVEISRSTSSCDICLTFEHNRQQWRIMFPPNYPKSPPEIGYYDRTELYHEIVDHKTVKSDIITMIQSKCSCKACRRHVV